MRIITGAARGRRLITLEGEAVRPTPERVKEGLFSMLQFRLEGRRVLDLFAGSGQMGLEALSRGAQSCMFIDASAEAMAVVKANAQKTALFDRCRFLVSDYRNFIRKAGSRGDRYSLIFLDPPYAEVFLENSLKRISEIDILSDSGIIITERPFGKELPAGVPGLVRYRDYRYGKAAVTIYRRQPQEEL